MLAAGLAAIFVGGTLLRTVIRQRPHEYGLEPIPLEGEVFHTGDHLGVPVDLAPVDGVVVVLDRHGEKNLHLIDAAGGTLIASVGNPGEGPAEFMAPATITRDADGRVWILDTTTQRMTRIDLARLGEATGWADSSFQLHGALVTDLSWTSSSGLLAGGAFLDARFGLLDRSGALTREVGAFPSLPGDLPTVLRQQAFQSRIAGRPDGRLFAVAARYAGRIDIVSGQGESRGQVSAPIPFEPEFVVGKKGSFPVAMFPPESALGYIDATAGRDFIFGLFSGRSEADFPGRDNYARDIHVFDWKGSLVAVLRADRDVFAIALDEDRHRLLAIAHDPVPAILSFPLPALEAPGRVTGETGPGVG